MDHWCDDVGGLAALKIQAGIEMDADCLVAYWSRIGTHAVHPDDRAVLPGDAFDTDLHPVPWVGPLKSAKVYVLFLNPGLSPADREYELASRDLREALKENLGGSSPCFSFLDRFSGYRGHTWSMQTYGRDVTEQCAALVCQINLVAYHSAEGRAAIAVAGALPSSLAVRRFVEKSLVPHAKTGKIGLVVARAATHWRIGAADESKNLVVYRGAEPRRAYMTAASRGGQLIRMCLGLGISDSAAPSQSLKVQQLASSGLKRSLAAADGYLKPRILAINNKAEAGILSGQRGADLQWKIGTPVRGASVREGTKRYAWLAAMQSVENYFQAVKLIVTLAGKPIEPIDKSHVRWAVKNGFLHLIE